MSDIPSSTAAIVLAMVDQVVAAETAAICSPSREPLVSGNALPLSDQILVPSSILSSTAKEQVNVQNNDIVVSELSNTSTLSISDDVTIGPVIEPLSDQLSSTQTSILNVDKMSLVWATMFAKAKADIEYYKLKWKGLDKSIIDEADTIKIKEKKDFLKYLRDGRNGLSKVAERFASSHLVKVKDVYNLLDVKHMQKSLNEIHGTGIYRIHLFEKEGDACNHIWSGVHPSQRNILLLKNGNTFQFPANLGKLLKKRYFCCLCLESCKFKVSHRCESVCRSCSESLLICNPGDGHSQQCSECNMFFFSKGCFERHRKANNNGSSRCSILRLCLDCHRVYNRSIFKPGESHDCSRSQFCHRCLSYVEPSKTHACYIPSMTEATKKRRKEQEKKLKIIAIDFESTQCVDKEDGSLEFEFLDDHEVVMAVARKTCFECIEETRKDKDAPCLKCGEKEKIIDYNNSSDIMNDFIDWLFQPEHNGALLYAHYGKYDLLLLLQALIRRKITPDVILKGRRIVAGKVTYKDCTIQLRDSYNLIPLPLAGFKKAFALRVSQKGEMPFLMIQKKYFGQVLTGPPEKRFFNHGSKSPEKEEEFLKWYESQDPEAPWDFDENLKSYCRNDVDILLLGLLEYRDAMMRMTNWCVLSNSVTLPSFALFVLRADHIPPRTICAVPDSGINNNRQQSGMAIRWLRWTMHTTGYNIQHIGNGGEKRIHLPMMSTFVDGYTKLENGEEIIYEFCGCYYHGHNTCFDPHGFNVKSQQTFGALYAATMERLKRISESYKLIVMWECDCAALLRRDKTMKSYFDSCEITRLCPRLAMQDEGRTEAHAVSIHADADNKIVYLDVNSFGWPAWVKTEADKVKCLQNYKDTMDISLTADEIADNSSLRSVSKMLLNSSWGKMAERSDMRKTIFCNHDELGELLDKKKRNIKYYREVGDGVFMVSLAMNPEEVHSSPFDSIIAVIPRDDNPFKSMINDGMGFLADECSGKEILSGFFGGPKQYALRLADEKTGEISHVIKIRGISLDSDARKVIDFEKFSKLVEEGGSVQVGRLNLKRKHTSIKTVVDRKVYKALNRKGKNINGVILPFGFVSDE